MSGGLLLSTLVLIGGLLDLCATFTRRGRKRGADMLFWWKGEKRPQEVRFSTAVSLVTELLLIVWGLGGNP